MFLTYVLRLKIVVFLVVCLILWQTLRYFYSSSELSNQGLVQHLSGAVVPSFGSVLPPVRLSVFYEALCPDSRSFFTKQLLPTFEKIPHLLEISLVPYGKAKTERVGESLSFTCQHGPLECQANKIHACAISKVTSAELQLRYITCMIIDNMNPEESGELCAKEHGILWSEIAECATSNGGDQLLKKHGEMTSSLKPHVSFIPTILMDEVIRNSKELGVEEMFHSSKDEQVLIALKSQDNQPGILKNLFKEVCKRIQVMQSVPECD